MLPPLLASAALAEVAAARCRPWAPTVVSAARTRAFMAVRGEPAIPRFPFRVSAGDPDGLADALDIVVVAAVVEGAGSSGAISDPSAPATDSAGTTAKTVVPRTIPATRALTLDMGPLLINGEDDKAFRIAAAPKMLSGSVIGKARYQIDANAVVRAALTQLFAKRSAKIVSGLGSEALACGVIALAERGVMLDVDAAASGVTTGVRASAVVTAASCTTARTSAREIATPASGGAVTILSVRMPALAAARPAVQGRTAVNMDHP